jgi:hypothetical protein
VAQIPGVAGDYGLVGSSGAEDDVCIDDRSYR